MASSGNGKLSHDIFSCQQEAEKVNWKWGKTIKTAPRELSLARPSHLVTSSNGPTTVGTSVQICEPVGDFSH